MLKKYYCISTTDNEAVLDVARKEKVDGVLAYATDPAATTAAYVAEKLNLPTNSYEAVKTLAYKDKFRTFLKSNGFNCPKASTYTSYSEIKRVDYPVLVKPVDSSGSRGISKVETIDQLQSAFAKALEYSRCKRVIIESFIVQDHPYMIGGDCFVLDGKVVYWGLLNCHRDLKANPLVPSGKSYPLLISKNRVVLVKNEIQKLVDCLAIKFGAFNIEAIIDKKERVFLIEMGPRNGGNMIPNLLNMINDIDLIKASVETAVGNYNFMLQPKANDGYYATYNLHALNDGILTSINYNQTIENKIIKKVIYKNIGDHVNYFDGANKALGIIFLKFASEAEQMQFMSNPHQWIQIKVKKV